MSKAILAALQQEPAHWLLGLGYGGCGQWEPFRRLPAQVIFNGDSGDELPIAPPEATNWVLAMIAGLRI